MRDAPDRRSPHFSTITTSHWLPPQASRYIPPPGPTPLSILLIRRASLLPYVPTPCPLDPSSDTPCQPRLANHAFHFGSLSTAYTGPVIHCLSPCPYRPSSVLQTSVGPGLLIPSAFYPPTPPHPTPPPPPPPPHWNLRYWINVNDFCKAYM